MKKICLILKIYFCSAQMKNVRTAKLLMGFTLVLLTAFQVYWLHKLYTEEYKSLQRNTDVLFRETLYNLQVIRFKTDTTLRGLPGDNLFMVNMINQLKKRIDDTTTGKRKSIMISIDTRVDHLPPPPFLKNDSAIKNVFIKKNGDHDKFLQSFHDTTHLHDSIPVIVIDSSYKKALVNAKVDVAFSVLKITDKNDPSCSGAFCTGNVPMGIFGLICYRASFNSPFIFLMKKISTQILLSILLIALTFISFIFIYRNLVAQKKLAEIKSDFINNITHELKTPIATVNVAIEALRSFGGLQNPERTKEYLDISALELQRLGLLVDKVLKLSLFESKEIVLQKDSFDVVEMIKEVMLSMKLQFEKLNAVTKLETGGKNFIIKADKIHITSVIYNLLDNALKYSRENPEIVVHVLDRQNYLEIRVADNGIGIPLEYRNKIFDQFFRVPHGDTHNIKGYGLGLSYVNDIVKRHHGFVEVETEVNKGSTFIIKIPFEEASVIHYDTNRRIYNGQ